MAAARNGSGPVIIVDTALQAREASGRPVRVGMIGAGFMGRGIANQIVNSVPGMRLVAIGNRTVHNGLRAYTEAGVRETRVARNSSEVSDAVRSGVACVSEDPMAICEAEGIDAVLEVTGDVELGARVCLAAFSAGKHVVLMNAEVDGTVGPILKVYADRAGVVLSGCDGDQPAVQLNLYRFVRSIGLTPLVCGNIKGLQDPYRNPTTQEGFAKKWGQNPYMVTSFADGTKISFEQAIVANATGMTVARRGMMGHELRGPIEDAAQLYDVDQLRELGGIVDYVVGARPNGGVYVIGTIDDPKQKHYLNLYKVGEGPLYAFYNPYHLCHFEAPLSAARAVLFRDAAIAPAGPPRVEVVATAKVDLQEGEVLDGFGGYKTYGQCETAAITAAGNLLPMGVAQACRTKRRIPKDQVLTYQEVELPSGRLCDRLRSEQTAHFANAVSLFTPCGANP
jgi:predicted homoserine dehydrogenase-like protein